MCVVVGLAAALHARMQASRAPPFWARHAFEHVANLIIGSLRLDDFERESLGSGFSRITAIQTGSPFHRVALGACGFADRQVNGWLC